MLGRFSVGVQLHPQLTGIEELRSAWRALDELGVDSIWVWDHFFPLYGDPDGTHFEALTLLSCMAADTRRATVGTLVTSVGYRNPDLLAHMAATAQQISAGRVVLGVGAGWFERDYVEYGYEFGRVGDRSAALAAALPRLRSRLDALTRSARPVPLLVGGGGEKVTLRLAARYADMWNCFGPAKLFGRKNRILDQWCERYGRDPREIERTVLMMQHSFDCEELLERGAQHVIIALAAPFDLGPVKRLLDVARG